MTTVARNELQPPAQVSRPMWLAAVAAAAVFHMGVAALAVAAVRAQPEDDELGAQTIEIGLEPAARRTEVSALPPGPESEASVASPAVPEQKEVVKETNLPKDEPIESEEPMRVVSVQDNKKPTEETPDAPSVQAAPSIESAAAEATTQPTMQLPREAEKTVAPNQGLSDSMRRLKATWQKQLLSHFDKHKRYPNGHARQSLEILVSFVLDRTGHVLSAAIARGSGDQAFDDAALSMVRRSDPVPAPPPLVADEGLNFTIPVVFRVRSRG